ncbi:MAG: methionine adenosyltransferase domain-containing protein, partial [Thioalkalispiraceae bacterium]
ISETARQVIAQVGYELEDFNAKDCTIMSNIHELPPPGSGQFSQENFENADPDCLTASHPVTTFGFACNQNKAFLPQPIWVAHQLARQLDLVRKQKQLLYLLADNLTQVSIEYQDRRPQRIHNISLLTSQISDSDKSHDQVESDLRESVIEPVLARLNIDWDLKTKIQINPEGPILGGGPTLHSGLTGRKSAEDTYGQYSRHSSSALSGKNPNRIERIAPYYARYVAKNVVAAGLADECEIQLSYTVAQSEPVSIQLDTCGTGKIDDEQILLRVMDTFDFRVGAIIHAFNLHTLPAKHKNGYFRQLARYGQMGRTDLDTPWEQTDKADLLG